MASIHFDITADNSSFLNAFKQVKEVATNSINAVDEAMKRGLDMSTPQAQIESYERLIKSLESAISSQKETLVEYGKELNAALEQGEKEKVEELLEAINDSTTAMEGNIDMLNTYKDALGQLGGQLDNAEEQTEEVSNSTTNYKDIINSLPAPLKNAVNGVMSLVKAAKAFIATPIGAVIAALVVVFQSLSSYFTSSAEGQMKWAKVMGYVTGIADQFKEVLISLGKTLVGLFEDPIGSLENFGKAVWDNLVVRVRSIGKIWADLGKILMGIVTFDWDKVSEGAKSFGSDWVDSLTGVENTIDKATNALGDLKNKAKERASIDIDTKNLEMAMSEWEKDKQKLEQEKSELKMKMTDTSLTRGERQAALASYKELINKEYAEELKFADKKIELQQRAMAITTNSREDEMKLNELQADRNRILREQQQEYTSLQRRANSISVKPSEMSSYNDAIRTLGKEQVRLLEDLANEEWQTRIDLMEEGAEKVLEQRKLDHQKELDQINREGEDLKEAYVERAKKAFEADPMNQNATFNREAFMQSDEYKAYASRIDFDTQQKTNAAGLKFVRASIEEEKEARNAYLKEYGDYEQKKLAITEDYEDRIKKAVTQGEKDSLTRKMGEELANLDIQYKKSGLAITNLFEDTKRKTVKEMREIANAGQKAFDFLKQPEWDEAQGAEIGITKEQFELWKKSPEELEKIAKAIRDINDAADQSDTAFNKMSDGLKEVFKAKDNKTLKEGLSKLASGANEVFNAVNFASDSLKSLGDSLGSGALSGLGDGLSALTDAGSAALSGAQAGAALGPWGAAAGAAAGAVTSLIGSLSKLHDAKYERKIQQIQQRIDTLQKNYAVLGDKIEQAFSKDASNLIEQQNKMLQQQKVLIQNQIKEEEKKKKTDNDRINEWKQQIVEIDNTLEDNKKKAVDAIFGEDVKSAIEDFASAYADAWANGEDKAKSAKDVVKNMMKQMVTESIKAAIQSSGAMDRIRQTLQSFYADNVLTGWEQDYIYNMAEGLQKQLDNQFGWADSLLGGSDSYSQEASAKAWGSMSQDQAEELNGRFTALYEVGVEQKAIVLSIDASIKEVNNLIYSSNGTLVEMRNLQIIANNHLEDIAKYTKPLLTVGSKLDKLIENTQ